MIIFVFQYLAGWSYYLALAAWIASTPVTWGMCFGYMQLKHPSIAKENRAHDRQYASLQTLIGLINGPFAVLTLLLIHGSYRTCFMWPWAPSPNYDWREWAPLNADEILP